jgi:methionyl-tRNA formyltransferase
MQRIDLEKRTNRPTRVAFFLGSDIISHLIANRLIPILLDSRISVRLYLTRTRLDRSRPRMLQQLFFVEHTLLQDYAYPYVDLHGVPRPERFNTPQGWHTLAPAQLTVSEVEDVNDPDFVAGLTDEHLDAAVSVRCYQKFRPPILNALGGPDSGSLFVNLHPGLLPHYRGVNTFLRSMLEGASHAGFTLHHLEPDWDTGAVIGQARFPLSYSRSVLENMIAHVTDAAGLVLDLIRRVAAGCSVNARPQDASQARYFSYPIEAELDRLTDYRIDVFRASAVIDTLVDAFFGTVPNIAQLRDMLIAAVDAADIPCEYTGDKQRLLILTGRR